MTWSLGLVNEKLADYSVEYTDGERIDNSRFYTTLLYSIVVDLES